MWKVALLRDADAVFAMGFMFMFTLGASPAVLSIVPATSAAGHLLRGGALPIRDGGRGVFAAFAASSSGCRMDRQMYDETLANTSGRTLSSST